MIADMLDRGKNRKLLGQIQASKDHVWLDAGIDCTSVPLNFLSGKSLLILALFVPQNAKICRGKPQAKSCVISVSRLFL